MTEACLASPDATPASDWPSYPWAKVRESLDIPATSAWRYVSALVAIGEVRRTVRMGGHGGTSCTIEFPGTLDQLATRILSLKKERGPPNSCPTCRRPLPLRRTGPPCPRCSKPVEVRGANSYWCPDCREGFLRRAGKSRLPPSRPNGKEGVET